MARRHFQKGHLFQRGRRNKVWVGRWREVVMGSDGRLTQVRRAEVLGFVSDLRTRCQAERVLADRLRPVNSGSHSHEVMRKFAEFVRDDWFPVVLPTLKYATQEHYRYLLRVHLLPAFGKLELRDISREVIQSFLHAKLKTNLSWKTVKHLRAALSKVMSTALEWGYVAENAVRKTKLPRRITKPEKPVLAPLEVRQLLETLREPSRSLVSLLVLTGVRIGELLALRWRNVDLKSGVLHVKETIYDGHFDEPKSRCSHRVIPLGPWGVAIFESRRPKVLGPDAFVFTTRRGTPLNRRNLLRRELKPACQKLGLTGVNWHSLRHCNATLLDAVGTPLGTVQALLGHSSSEVTREIYLHSLPAGAREAVEKVEQLVIGPKLDPSFESAKTGASVIQ